MTYIGLRDEFVYHAALLDVLPAASGGGSWNTARPRRPGTNHLSSLFKPNDAQAVAPAVSGCESCHPSYSDCFPMVELAWLRNTEGRILGSGANSVMGDFSSTRHGEVTDMNHPEPGIWLIVNGDEAGRNAWTRRLEWRDYPPRQAERRGLQTGQRGRVARPVPGRTVVLDPLELVGRASPGPSHRRPLGT